MSIKYGFGSLRETLRNQYVLGVRQANTNSNAVIQLPAKYDKRIFSLSASYIIEGVGSVSVLPNLGGRLLVVGTKFDSYTDEIQPFGNLLPNSLNNAQIYFDMPIMAKANQSFTLNKGICISEHFDFPNGIYIPESTDLSIILTYAYDGNDNYPASGAVVGLLNASGLVGGTDKIFKNVS